MLELLVALGIFSLIIVSVAWLLIHGFRYNGIIWEQLKTQSDGRRVLRETVDVVRKAEQSSIGSYPIANAGAYDLTVYSNVDSDSYREKVRFWLDGATFKRNIIKPSGNPLAYSGIGQTVEIAHDAVNIAKGEALFSYFDENYTGVEMPMVQPVDTTKIRVVRIRLELEKDPTETPVPLRVESTAQVRNLKQIDDRWEKITDKNNKLGT